MEVNRLREKLKEYARSKESAGRERKRLTAPLYRNMTRKTKTKIKDRYVPFSTVTEEEADMAINLYDFLLGQVRVPTMKWCGVDLLGKVCVEAARCGQVNLWRFVCMPEMYAKFSNSGKFNGWDITWNNYRYNTLTPPLKFDREVLEGLSKLGIKPNLSFVFDDWEILWLRMKRDQISGSSEYYRLGENERREVRNSLLGIKPDVINWVKNYPLNFKFDVRDWPLEVIFFSDIIDYEDYTELLMATSLEMNPQYAGIMNAEVDFVKKSRKGVTEFAAQRIAATRISQYVVEGSILAAHFPENSIYLNSEYPVQNVWKKLTLLADVPTLFYVQDSWVKNV